jgi:hypothetical protein
MEVAQEKAALNKLNKPALYEWCKTNGVIDPNTHTFNGTKVEQLKAVAHTYLDGKINLYTEKINETVRRFIPQEVLDVFKVAPGQLPLSGPSGESLVGAPDASLELLQPLEGMAPSSPFIFQEIPSPLLHFDQYETFPDHFEAIEPAQ